jgi:cephalosporin hydroxylase
MTEAAELIGGDELKAAALEFIGEARTRIEREQIGLRSIFDSWLTRVLAQLTSFDPTRSWEDSVRENAMRLPGQDQSLQWDLQRLRLFLDRWRQGRFVDFSQRERSGAHYHPRFGTEFGVDVLLTCQGAPALMRWRGTPLMKNVFDFAMYPALIAELRPRTVFEIGSGLGASAIWFADTMTLCGIEGRVHSVDRMKVAIEHPRVEFRHGDCSDPEHLFDPELLGAEPHPWLVVEDAHHNVGAVLEHFHKYLSPGDYLVVEDSDVKRETLRQFVADHPGAYLVDTRFTDNFGRNATCAGDSIFVRTPATG